LTRAEAARLGLDRTRGIYVSEVDRGSPADIVGIKEGDLIIHLDGPNINSYEDLVACLFATYRPGDRLQILRGNNEFPVGLELGTLP
jgi:S1-C subfamily serine protease